jgi:hypothetical protein
MDGASAAINAIDHFAAERVFLVRPTSMRVYLSARPPARSRDTADDHLDDDRRVQQLRK